MVNLIINAVFIGSLTVTAYRSVKSQTDSSPFYTSTNEHVSRYGVAISQDLLCPVCLKLHRRCKRPDQQSKIHYGDWVYIENVGLRCVNDIMNQMHKKRFDVWVADYDAEKDFDKKYRNLKLKVWLIKINEKQENKTVLFH